MKIQYSVMQIANDPVPYCAFQEVYLQAKYVREAMD